MPRIAVVTGSNKGIGLATVQILCQKHPDWTVYLTSRDEGRGKAAVGKLKSECKEINPHFHQLDIDDVESVEKLRDFLLEKHGGLDVLINNAAIAFKMSATEPFSVQAEITTKTNYFNTMRVCSILFPILRPHARVVHVSSRVACLVLAKCSKEIVGKFQNPESLEFVDKMMTEFVASAKEDTNIGYPQSAYGISKAGVIAATVVQQRLLDKDTRDDLIVNCCCPGFVDTDMSSHQGYLTPGEGAATAVFLAELPADDAKNPKGKFLAEKKVIPWKPMLENEIFVKH